MVVVYYVLFLLSGAAGLIYEVAWTRALGLVFGGSHLAVTTVLAVYMGGLALGGVLWGRRADRTLRPLRLYAVLELGVALFAGLFLLLMEFYPAIYVPLARLAEENRTYLTALRVGFATLAMIVPTTLMGGTLPALSRLMGDRPEGLKRHLPFLYGVNTFGAIAGVLAAGFFLLEKLGANWTLGVAMAANVLVGLVALLLPEQPKTAGSREEPVASKPQGEEAPELAYRLVLWGIGISGFCALGYEVLWTRVLSMVVGTTVYGITLILAAFLTGIALGSWAVGLWKGRMAGGRRLLVYFAAAEICAGLSALAVTVFMGGLPAVVGNLQKLLFGGQGGTAQLSHLLRFAVAFGYVLVPAFFLGAAFPLAGLIHSERRRLTGKAVGEVLTFNTVGAILGSAVSGFFLVYLLGAERSLLILVTVNVGLGLAVLASLRGRFTAGLAGAATLIGVLVVGLALDRGALWDTKRFATYVNNQPEIFESAEELKRGLARFEVLYYFEGANETISVVRSREQHQAFIVNGRSEATTAPADVQCQRTLGHLPMLLHPDPKKIFVLGAGSGMTLGAITLHPEVESIVLAEIEPGALPATRSFGEYNHQALDNPKLRVVFNDGRNHLFTTSDRFDVVTADPIHPWCGGASYLYTQEYFQTVASRLRPGGVAAQWLPIYELTPEDLATVVRTFGTVFPHVMIWLTHYDAELVGSLSPIVIDETALERRMARPEIAGDLAAVGMGTPEAFLSYFLAGDTGARAFAKLGVVNTDDNLFLEFSSPKSMGHSELQASNVQKLMSYRESITAYLTPVLGEPAESARLERWSRLQGARMHCDRAQLLALAGIQGQPPFTAALEECEAKSPGFGPASFLRKLAKGPEEKPPQLLGEVAFELGARRLVLSVVAFRLSAEKADVHVVDNSAREIYGTALLNRPSAKLEEAISGASAELLATLRAAYGEQATVKALRTAVQAKAELLSARSGP